MYFALMFQKLQHFNVFQILIVSCPLKFPYWEGQSRRYKICIHVMFCLNAYSIQYLKAFDWLWSSVPFDSSYNVLMLLNIILVQMLFKTIKDTIHPTLDKQGWMLQDVAYRRPDDKTLYLTFGEN